jgi:hypothetical protein
MCNFLQSAYIDGLMDIICDLIKMPAKRLVLLYWFFSSVSVDSEFARVQSKKLVICSLEILEQDVPIIMGIIF